MYATNDKIIAHTILRLIIYQKKKTYYSTLLGIISDKMGSYIFNKVLKMYIEIDTDNKELRRIFTKEEKEKDLDLFLSSLQLVNILYDTNIYETILGEE